MLFLKTSRDPSGVWAVTEACAHVIVAGSGLAGLTCAAELAPEMRVTVFERLPVLGGADWEVDQISVLTARVTDAGATAVCGTQALRWERSGLFAAGMAGGVCAADLLVIATGHRPATAAEWGIGGMRCGGVISGTVATHLLASKVLPGRRPVVLGDSRLARRVSAELLRAGAHEVIRVAPGPLADAVAASGITLMDAVPLSVKGRPRIEALEVMTSSGGVVTLPCDALVLAGKRLPYRNVDGALEACDTVVIAQCCEGEDSDVATEQAGRAAASRVRDLLHAPSARARCGLEAM